MCRIASFLATFAIVALVATAAPTAAQDYAANIEQYKSEPFLKFIPSIPQVMIVLERDWKIFGPAYNTVSDLNGDGSIDVGFNPAFTYVGYFDVDSCYAQKTSLPNTWPATGPVLDVAAGTHYFYRVGPAQPQGLAEAISLRPTGLSPNIPSPPSRHGICPGTSTNGYVNKFSGFNETSTPNAKWSGNWLNYLVTSRMDAIRRVLYGGKRRVDTDQATVLEPSYVTPNGMVWGTEIVADDLWNDYASESPYYSCDLFTGFDKPQAGNMHFFARVTSRWNNTGAVNTSYPEILAEINVKGNWPQKIHGQPLRYWDWAYGGENAVVPDRNILPSGTVNVNGTLVFLKATEVSISALVQSCQDGNIGLSEGCKLYGSVHKPVGLMQHYGEQSGMQFGLITATVSRETCVRNDKTPAQGSQFDFGFYSDWRCNDKGGVLRHHVDKLPGKGIDASNGRIIPGGIVDTISKFELSDYLWMQYPNTAGFAITDDVNAVSNRVAYGTSTGNALGEMTMEALRYLSGAAEGLAAYKLPSGATEQLDLSQADWADRPSDPLASCVKPFVLVISAIYPSFDGDDHPSPSELLAPRLTHLTQAQAPDWSAADYLEKITQLEKYRQGNNLYYFPKTDHDTMVRGLCTAKEFSGAVSLANISGFCPSEPGMAGSYSLAAAAYYGHTHDFTSDGRNTPAEFFVVALSPSIPHLTITDGKGHSADLMPTAVTAPAYRHTGFRAETLRPHHQMPNDFMLPTVARPTPRTMSSFVMRKAEADENGVNYRMEFMANFAEVAEPNEKFSRRHLDMGEVALLTTKDTPEMYRETRPYVINSGPFKTTYDVDSTCNGSTPQKTIPDGQISHLACPFVPDGHTAYYAFKKPSSGRPLEVKNHNVVGIAVITSTLGSITHDSGAVGYTITGVKRPGVYLDAATIGRDWYHYALSQAYPYPKTAVIDGTSYTWRLGIPRGGKFDYANVYEYNYPNVTIDPLLTPWDCPYAGYDGPDASSLCGPGQLIANGATGNINKYQSSSEWNNKFYTGLNKMAYIQIRSFEFEEGAGQPQNLPNPLWLAAKYGGFKDIDQNGEPDPGEWDSEREGVPDNYFEVANLSELPAQLGKAFERISKAGEAVTATADSITSVLGGGLAIQTSYVPEFTSALDASLEVDKRVMVKWVGNTFSLFIDKWGNLREDTNQNGVLDVITGPSNPNGGDLVVIFKNQSDSDNAKITLLEDEHGTNNLQEVGTAATLYDLKSVWNASNLLSDIGNSALETPRAFSAITAGRRLYSYAGAALNPSAGFTSAVKLNNDHLLSVARAPAYAPLMGQGYTLSTPAKITGMPCDTVASGKCGPDHVPCQEIHISAVGSPPQGVTSIKVIIDDGVSPGQTFSSQAGGLLELRMGLTTAKGVVATLNDYLLGNLTPGVIRAHLNAGDLGSWYPANGASVILPTMADPAHRQATVENLIRYTYGQDIPGWRSRSVCTPGDDLGKKTWRLGDVINSKPVIVAEPVSAYDLLYGDQSYSNFKKNYPDNAGAPGVRSRRIVAYMGSNDGVLHALNLGFYGSLADGTIGYSDEPFARVPGDSTTIPDVPVHKLGSELWGYVPTSVLPHLTWASDPEYAHSYYVDLEPMIVDIKNTTNSSINLGGGKFWTPGEWRTILIGGLRMGGRTIELDNGDSPVQYLYSEYFALDVTDPEEEPALLWRFSHQDLGLTITKPAVVSSQDGWHVLVGSGPTTDLTNASMVRVPAGSGGELAYSGVSNQKARVFVLNAYTGALQKVMGGEGDAFMPQGQSMPANSFFNNSFVVSSVGPGSASLVTQGATPGSVEWHNPTVYFGLTVSRDSEGIDSGGVYRVQMVRNDGTPAPVGDWKLTTMYKTDRPVTGAVNATFDALGHMWVVFGTGRLWSEADQDPTCSALANPAAQAACEDNHVQYLYGLKEPMSNGLLTYAEIKESGQAKIAEVTEARVYEDGTVQNYDTIGATTYNNVLQLMGSDSYLGYKRGLNIWAYTNTTHSFNTRKYEMILTQPKLDPLPNGRSNLVVSTYEPSTELCDPEGHSYLYLVDTYTGLPAPYMAGYNFENPSASSSYTIPAPGLDPDGNANKYGMITGYLSSGQGQATEAWIIKSENATVYGNTSANQVQNKIILEAAVDGFTTGSLWWREVLDLGLNLSDEELTRGLPTAHE